MKPTPETLTRHELVGLHVRVVSASNPSLVGIEGRVVAETMHTLSVESADASRVWQVQKQGTKFEFALTDETADARERSGTTSKPATGEDAVYVTVDGAKLLSRPALRTETGVDSKWQ